MARDYPCSPPPYPLTTTHHVPHSTVPPQPLGSAEHSAPLVQAALGTHAAALLVVQRCWHVVAPGGACSAIKPVGHFVHTSAAAPPLPPFFFVVALVPLRAA